MVHEYFERVIQQKPKNSFGDRKTNTARDVDIYLARELTNENERNLSVYFGDIVDAGILCGITK
jgi:chromosomal replication initiation ATPase DnaA